MRRLVAALSGPIAPLLVVFLSSFAPARLYAESGVPDTGSGPQPCSEFHDPACDGLTLGSPCVTGTANGTCSINAISCTEPDGGTGVSIWCRAPYDAGPPSANDGGTTPALDASAEGGPSEDASADDASADDASGATPGSGTGSSGGGCSVGIRAGAASDLVPLAALGIGLVSALRRRRRRERP